MTRGDYLLCGWRVRSELPILELPTWNGPGDAAADVTIVEGVLPERLEDQVTPGRYLMVGADGSVLLHIAGLVRFRVRGGREIVVHMLRKEARDVWRTFLLGSVLGYLCHQRGVFPLHAATLRVGGRTIAVAGHRGSGKSTLALALAQRGHALLSDDLTVLQPAEDGIEVLPAFPRLKLWRAALEANGIGIEGLPRVREGLEKYDLQMREGFDSAPTPLAAILNLRENAELSLALLPATQALPGVQAHICRARIARALGREAALFAQSARIVAAVPVYRLNRPKRFDVLPATVTLIESLCER